MSSDKPFYLIYFPDIEHGDEKAIALTSRYVSCIDNQSLVRVGSSDVEAVLESVKSSMTNERVLCSDLIADAINVCIIPVSGMTCNSCVKLIDTSLSQPSNGITKVCTSLKRNETFVEFNSTQTSPSDISTAIYDMGFDVGTPVVYSPTPDTSTPNQMMTATIKVTGMVCQSCVKNIETNVGDKHGIYSIDVSLDSNTAVVTFDPTVTTINNICNVIDDLGFIAAPVDNDQCNDVGNISYRIGIDHMTCHSCVALIEDVVNKRDGVHSMVVSLPLKAGTVVFDHNIASIDAIKGDIEDAGFDVTYIQEVKDTTSSQSKEMTVMIPTQPTSNQIKYVPKNKVNLIYTCLYGFHFTYTYTRDRVNIHYDCLLLLVY